MREELDNALCKKYPKIFAQRHLPMTETAMCWGFDCGDGWYDILESLCNQIQHHVDWKQEQKERYNRGEGCAQVVAVQVKEKFASLRFYYEGGDEHIHGMVRMAESWASKTCETCGDKGKHRVESGWHYVSCDKHVKKGRFNE